MDDKSHLPEGLTPSEPDEEKIQDIDFSDPWEEDSLSDDEKIDQIDFSVPWAEEPDENEKIDQIDFSTPWEEPSVKSNISLEKQEEPEIPLESGIPTEKEEIEIPIQSTIPPEKPEISVSSNQNAGQPQNVPYPPYPSQNPPLKNPNRNYLIIIAVLAILLILIVGVVIWLVILPTFKGRVNIADDSEISSEITTQPDTLPPPTEPPTTLPPETEPPTTLPPPTEPPKPSYQVLTGKYTWESAERKAQEMGGHLASIHSEEEWYAVVDAINQAKASVPDLKYIWLGASSEIDTNANTVTFYWTDGSDTSWLMNGNTHWYYNAKLGISEPSGYDANEYQQNGTLIREPYLMMWLPSDSIAWSMNDVPDVSSYSNYKDSNMGYVIRIDSTSNM